MVKIETKCSWCGEDLNRKPSRIYKYSRQYCGEECQRKHYEILFKGKNNPNYKNSLTKICQSCGKEYNHYSTKRKFCSLKCAYGDTKETRKCINCGKDFVTYKKNYRKTKFCSSKCNYEGQQRQFMSKRITKTCPICKREFEVTQANSYRISCSLDCVAELRKIRNSGSGNPRWLGGTEDYRGVDWGESRRKALVRDDFKCLKCKEDNCLLHVHHLVPYRKTKDNSLLNLITLCPRCHTTEENNFRRFGKPSRSCLELVSESEASILEKSRKYPVPVRVIKP